MLKKAKAKLAVSAVAYKQKKADAMCVDANYQQLKEGVADEEACGTYVMSLKKENYKAYYYAKNEKICAPCRPWSSTAKDEEVYQTLDAGSGVSVYDVLSDVVQAHANKAAAEKMIAEAAKFLTDVAVRKKDLETDITAQKERAMAAESAAAKAKFERSKKKAGEEKAAFDKLKGARDATKGKVAALAEKEAKGSLSA